MRSLLCIQSKRTVRGTAVCIAVGALLAACGGSGSPSASLSGVALTGAALKNAPITIIDSAGNGCASATSSDTGAWTASLASCSAGPYLIKASSTDLNGQPIAYYSAATADEVSNGSSILVSQVTDALVKLALRTDTPTAAGSATLTAEKLKDASAQLLAGLVPSEVTTDSNIDTTKDLRTMAVTAGSGVGLDKLHDRLPEIKVMKSGTELQLTARATRFGATGSEGIVVGATISQTASTGTQLAAPTQTELNGVVVVSKDNATTAKIVELPLIDRVKGEVSLMLAAWDQVYATAVPADYAGATAFNDVCYLNDGYDKAIGAAEWNENVALAREGFAYRVGAKRTNLKVVSAERSADGKYTTAVVQYDIEYTDGTKNKAAENTLITGDSSAKCAAHGISGTAQSGLGWRFIGNGRQVAVMARPANVLYVPYKLTDGTSNGSSYRENRLNFWVQDFRDQAITYIVVTGPSLPGSGVKMLSPMVMRDAAELQGKTGNYKNYDAHNNAQMCSYRYTSGTTTYSAWDADKADCLTYGGSSNFWNLKDTSIDALPVNAEYTFKLYNDDGWKTVNGQSGKTPVYTYTSKLPAKPFKSTELTDANFPQTTSQNGVDFLTMSKGTGGMLKLDMSAPVTPAGAEKFAFNRVWQYMRGPLASNTTGANWPRNRYIWYKYPNGTANLTGMEFPVSGKPAEIGSFDYIEGTIRAVDRNGRYLETTYFYN